MKRCLSELFPRVDMAIYTGAPHALVSSGASAGYRSCTLGPICFLVVAIETNVYWTLASFACCANATSSSVFGSSSGFCIVVIFSFVSISQVIGWEGWLGVLY